MTVRPRHRASHPTCIHPTTTSSTSPLGKVSTEKAVKWGACDGGAKLVWAGESVRVRGHGFERCLYALEKEDSSGMLIGARQCEGGPRERFDYTESGEFRSWSTGLCLTFSTETNDLVLDWCQALPSQLMSLDCYVPTTDAPVLENFRIRIRTQAPEPSVATPAPTRARTYIPSPLPPCRSSLPPTRSSAVRLVR